MGNFFRKFASPLLVLAAAGGGAAAGCIGNIGGSDAPEPTAPAPPVSAAATPPAPTPSPASPASVPLARLTAVQYANSVRDLFAPVAVPVPTLPQEIAIDGFVNNAAAETPSAVLIEQYAKNAKILATAATIDPSRLLPCKATTSDAEVKCGEQYLATLAQRAYRRPLTTDETQRLTHFFEEAHATNGLRSALSLAIEVILQSPNFLYRVELPVAGAVPDASGRVAIDDYAMASRLSYLLWDTLPDAALFTAAANRDLSDPKRIEKHARRLLGDSRSHAPVLNFHAQWLRFDKMQSFAKDAQTFPMFSDGVAQAMRDSVGKFVEHAFFDNGSLSSFLTDNHVYANDLLAPIYGVPSPGATLSLVAADTAQRSGILTQAGLMAAFAHTTADSPVLRGVFVLDRIMCSAPPPPPAGVNTSPPKFDGAHPKTTRELFAQTHEQGSCAGCHHAIDGVGFGFEHYDAIGRFRTTDSGYPVDASGWLPNVGDLTGTFDGAVELGAKLAQSHTVHSCVTSQWVRYALGLDKSEVDDAMISPLVAAFEGSKLDLRELVVAIATSTTFRTKTP